MAIVVFDPAAFKAAYPEFAAVSDPQLNFDFLQACLYLSNDDCSPVQNIARRTLLLWMLTAHIAALASRNANGGIVGRISSATEGSVSVGSEYMTPGSAAWFTQTGYGASFWQATVSLRGFKYRAQPTLY